MHVALGPLLFHNLAVARLMMKYPNPMQAEGKKRLSTSSSGIMFLKVEQTIGDDL